MDHSAPTVSYNNLTANQVFPDSSPKITGTISDASGIATATGLLQSYNYGTSTWTAVSGMNNTSLGITAGATSGSFTIDMSSAGLNLAEGKYQLSLTLTDVTTPANSATTTTIPFYIDHTAPTVTITSPASGSAYYTGFTVSGTASDANLQSVAAKLDGTTTLTVGGTASAWTIALSAATVQALSEGAHSIAVAASDYAGNTSTAQTLSFRMDHTAPTVTYSNLSSGSVFAGSTPVISGTVSDASGIATATGTIQSWNYVTLAWSTVSGMNAKSLGITAGSTSGSFTIDMSSSGLNLAEGKYQLSLTLTDVTTPANSTTTTYIPFYIDHTVPVVAITSPSSGSAYNQGFTVSGTVTEANLQTVSATLDGTAATVSTTPTASGANWSITLLAAQVTALNENNVHTIAVNSTDYASNSATTQTLTFRYDKSAPTVTYSNLSLGLGLRGLDPGHLGDGQRRLGHRDGDRDDPVLELRHPRLVDGLRNERQEPGDHGRLHERQLHDRHELGRAEPCRGQVPAEPDAHGRHDSRQLDDDDVHTLLHRPHGAGGGDHEPEFGKRV